jgi:hypothetical protein
MRDTIRKSANRYAATGRTRTRTTAAQARMAASRLEAADALKHNRCPRCGGCVRTNSALTGWVQCDRLGEFPVTGARCDWQGFTE